MLFSSHEFIFLPIALIGYFALRAIAGKTVTLLWLAAASLGFYSAWDSWRTGWRRRPTFSSTAWHTVRRRNSR
jgi:hypothetical protein